MSAMSANHDDAAFEDSKSVADDANGADWPKSEGRKSDGKIIDDDLRMYTASRLADVRDSHDGQEGMGAFLEKRKPSWTNVDL